MRIKNKEINARRHRKEQKIKDAAREIRAKYGDGKTQTGQSGAPKKTTAAKSAPKAAPAKAAAPKKAAEPAAKATAAPKKPAAPKAKKAEPKSE